MSLTGRGSGTVTSQPQGLSCGSSGGTCQATFPGGTTVTLTATPDAGMAFAGWAQACAGTGACAVTLDADRTVEAAFNDPVLAVATVGPAGGTMASTDGRLTLTIPPGALSESRELTIRELDPTGLGAPFTGIGASAAYDLGPDGLQFAAPVVATYRLDEGPGTGDSLTAGVELLLTESGGIIEPLDSLTTRVAADGTRTAEGRLAHFSPLVWRSKSGTVSLTILGVPAEAEVGTDVPIRFELVADPGEVNALMGSGLDLGDLFRRRDGAVFTIDVAADVHDWRCVDPGDGGFFQVHGSVDVTPGFFKTTETYGLDLQRPVKCLAAPEPPPTPSLTPGFWPTIPVNNGFLVALLGARFGQLQSAVQLAAIGGEDSQGNGVFALFDLWNRALAIQRAVNFFVFGTVGIVADPVGALHAIGLFSWGTGGYALHGSDTGAPEDLDVTPREERTDIRVNDAVPAGGGEASEAIVFASRDLGVGFVRYRPGMGIGVSEEILPASQFFGTVISAATDTPDGPAVVLAMSSNSRVYFHPRNGGTPTMAFSGLGSVVNGMRCRNPFCVVLPTPGAPLILFRFDGQNMPQRLADIPLTFTATGAALLPTMTGTMGVAITGFGVNSSDARAVEFELASDGSVLNTFPVSVPDACDSPGRPAYVPDGDGAALVVPCTSSDGYVVARSMIVW